jgi:exopolysaccharide biosynthesis polyprenyl glycosylphosphotransferase
VTGASFAAGIGALSTVVAAIVVTACFAILGLYRQRFQRAVLDDVPRLLLGVAAVPPILGYGVPLWWSVVALATVGLTRGVGYHLLHRRRGLRLPGERTIIIGSGDLAIRLAETLRADAGFGLRPIGLIGPPALLAEDLPVPLLGPVEQLSTVLDAHGPDSVVVTFPGPPDADLVGPLRRWRAAGIRVYLVPRLFELALHRDAQLVQGIPLIALRPVRRGQALAKRAIDLAGAGLGLALLWPVFALCALAVRLESGTAGVLFRQQRIGVGGRPFMILKFRSLTPSTDRESQVRWNISDDERVGPVGRFLRRSSLDELPQLLNVLRGDMSLVGPRPERPYFVEQFERTHGGYADRHRMPAGITGWAQINGLRGDTSIAERVRFDNHYIENWSLGLDLKIMMRTAGSMLRVSRRWQ